MNYQEMCEFYTQGQIPKAWKEAVVAEKAAEILIYHLVTVCLESFSDTVLELDSEAPVAKVLMSWKNRKQIDFGRHAIQLDSPQDGKVTLRCIYDINEIKEDMEMLATEMFGTIDSQQVGEKSLYDDDVEIPDGVIHPLFLRIQKQKIISE